MNNTAQITSGKQKILIVSEHPSPLSSGLKEYMRKYDNEMFVSPKTPASLAHFDYCFIINDPSFLKHPSKFGSWKKVVIVVSGARSKALEAVKSVRDKKLERVKIIYCQDPAHVSRLDIDEVIWFSLSGSSEILFALKTSVLPKPKHTAAPHPNKLHIPLHHRLYLHIEKYANKRTIFAIALLVVLGYHLAFTAPLALGTFYVYQAVRAAQSNDLPLAKRYVQNSRMPVAAAKKLYNLVRPTFLLFSIAKLPDDAFAIHETAHAIMDDASDLQENAHDAFILILRKNKTAKEKESLLTLLNLLKKDMSGIENRLAYLNQKIPGNLALFKPYKDKLVNISSMLTKGRRIMPFISQILAAKGENKYLLLFANNMELRPGGGFIGSYGVLTMKDLTFMGIEVYDVYDADGQLTAHVKPPEPIRQYLSQPHWFLRDSAFSPDFYENYHQAKFFLDKEKQMTDFAGGIMVTTTAIKNILNAYGDIYVPDFNEKVNADNFYLKTQLYAEKNFFPGSTQKKSFLSALTRQIMVNLETVPEQILISQLFTSAEEKQLVFYFEIEELQRIVDSYYWSGRIIEPQCPTQVENCYTDFLFPYDANLGVNKANFFMNRTMATKIIIDEEGIAHTSLTVKFRNESMQDIFPGGTYRNYFQILLPRDSVIKEIRVGEERLETYDQEIGQFKKVGFFFEVPPSSTKDVTVQYHSMKAFKKGKSVYQLLFQKQVGSINNDLSLEISLPSNMFLVNQNFSPLVKHNQILYNTELSADKIFFIELLKE